MEYPPELLEGHKHPDFAYFASIPWCAAHLPAPESCGSSDTAAAAVWVTPGRILPDWGFEIVMATTLNTPSTIPHLLYFCDAPPGGRSAPVESVNCLAALGDDVASNPGMCSGGIVAQLVDAVAANVAWVNVLRGSWDPRMSLTRSLAVEYVRGVRVPAVVLVRARLSEVRADGFVTEVVVEDERARVLTRAKLDWFRGFVRSKV